MCFEIIIKFMMAENEVNPIKAFQPFYIINIEYVTRF